MIKEDAARTLPERKKYTELDIAKALALIFLPAIHIVDEASLCGFVDPASLSFLAPIKLLMLFGPAMFMICLGCGLAGGGAFKRLRKSGIQFLLIGYGLNFICFSLPQIICIATGRLSDWQAPFMSLLSADIYVFVGWFYIFFAYMKRLRISDFKLVMICLVMLLANGWACTNVNLPASVPAAIAGNFIWVNGCSYFPLFGWAIFPTIGMVFRRLSQQIDMRAYQTVIRRSFAVAALVVAATFVSLFQLGVDVFAPLKAVIASYQVTALSAVLLTCIAWLFICILRFVIQAVRESALERFLLQLSSNIMAYYVIQWMLVSVVVWYAMLIVLQLPANSVSAPVSLLIMAALVVLCIVLTRKYGFTLTKFLLKITDYKRWFKRRLGKVAS